MFIKKAYSIAWKYQMLAGIPKLQQEYLYPDNLSSPVLFNWTR